MIDRGVHRPQGEIATEEGYLWEEAGTDFRRRGEPMTRRIDMDPSRRLEKEGSATPIRVELAR